MATLFEQALVPIGSITVSHGLCQGVGQAGDHTPQEYS